MSKIEKFDPDFPDKKELSEFIRAMGWNPNMKMESGLTLCETAFACRMRIYNERKKPHPDGKLRLNVKFKDETDKKKIKNAVSVIALMLAE